MSAAHTVLENGGKVVLIDKASFCGGNSTKATSGINAAGSRTQRLLDIPDTPEIFENDTTASAAGGARPNLIKTLTHESGPAVNWLMDRFGLDLSVVSRLAAHSEPRTHRGKERFPGMMITYGLMERLDEMAAQADGRVRIVTKAQVAELIQESSGEIVGCKYEKKGRVFTEMGPVIIATGGFGADFTDDSLLANVEKDWATLNAWQSGSRAGKQGGGVNIKVPGLRDLPTTNGPHCTGDGIKMAIKAGADTYDMHCVQVHPTGLIDPIEPEAKLKFLAAEALRGSGGIILDREGKRFCDELGKRDYVTGRMWLHDKAPYRLLLNKKASSLISWHCEHYQGRGLMKEQTGAELVKEMGISREALQETLDNYNKAGENPGTDKWGKKFFDALPQMVNDTFNVALITPVVHYCMGGVAANEHAEVIKRDGGVLPGLFVGGEALGGLHGENRLGGSSLLDCVVYGRVAGKSASKFLLNKLITHKRPSVGPGATVHVQAGPGRNTVSLNILWEESRQSTTAATGPKIHEKVASLKNDSSSTVRSAVSTSPGNALTVRTYSSEEVAKHTSDTDCWVVLEGHVYDVTGFLSDHPGGKKAIMLYAGKDATKEFAMLHKPNILTKYAVEYKLGPLSHSARI